MTAPAAGAEMFQNYTIVSGRRAGGKGGGNPTPIPRG